MSSSFESFQKRRLVTSYVSVTLSIALVLFVVGVFGILVLNTQKVANHFKEQLALTVYLNDSTNEAEIEQLRTQLAMAPYTKSVRFVSKEEAAEAHSTTIGENFMDFLGYNPLQNSLDVFINATFVTAEKLEEIEAELTAQASVSEVTYDRPLVELLNDNIKKISLWILAISAGFLIVAILLINNSIRLAIYSKRLIIKTMQMVGATKRFIRGPFIYIHMQLGLLAAVLALTGVYFVIRYLDQVFPDLQLQSDHNTLLVLFGGVLLLGLVITAISTFFATQRYLNLKTDQLY